jgi:hypothetical protein
LISENAEGPWSQKKTKEEQNDAKKGKANEEIIRNGTLRQIKRTKLFGRSSLEFGVFVVGKKGFNLLNALTTVENGEQAQDA